MNDIEMINKIKNFNLLTEKIIKVYRSLENEYRNDWSGIEYFSINKNYAENFGDKVYDFLIDTDKAKILDLSYWNKLYKDKTGINGNKYNRVQGIFVIGEESIATNYEEPLSRFAMVFPSDIVQKFINELNECDAIYGEDAGYHEFVFAVKNKSILTKI